MDTKLTDEEAWSAAKDGAKDWAKEKAVGVGIDIVAGPVMAPLVHLVRDSMKGPDKPPPKTERERQIRENYDAMQRTLDIASFAVSLEAGSIAGTAAELRAASKAAKAAAATEAGLSGGKRIADKAKTGARTVDRKPRGFTTDRAKPGRNVKPGTLEGLEPTAHDSTARPRTKRVT